MWDESAEFSLFCQKMLLSASGTKRNVKQLTAPCLGGALSLRIRRMKPVQSERVCACNAKKMLFRDLFTLLKSCIRILQEIYKLSVLLLPQCMYAGSITINMKFIHIPLCQLCRMWWWCRTTSTFTAAEYIRENCSYEISTNKSTNFWIDVGYTLRFLFLGITRSKCSLASFGNMESLTGAHGSWRGPEILRNEARDTCCVGNRKGSILEKKRPTMVDMTSISCHSPWSINEVNKLRSFPKSKFFSFVLQAFLAFLDGHAGMTSKERLGSFLFPAVQDAFVAIPTWLGFWMDCFRQVRPSPDFRGGGGLTKSSPKVIFSLYFLANSRITVLTGKEIARVRLFEGHLNQTHTESHSRDAAMCASLKPTPSPTIESSKRCHPVESYTLKRASQWRQRREGYQRQKENQLLETGLRTEITIGDGRGRPSLFWVFQPEAFSSWRDPPMRSRTQQEGRFTLVWSSWYLAPLCWSHQSSW